MPRHPAEYIYKLNQKLHKIFGTWLSLVERLLWEQDAAGSNPVVPTTETQFVLGLFSFISCEQSRPALGIITEARPVDDTAR